MKRYRGKAPGAAFFAASEFLQALTKAVNQDQVLTVEVSEEGKRRPVNQMRIKIYPAKTEKKSIIGRAS